MTKILGSNNPVTNELFTITEGIGKPLRAVDEDSGGSGTPVSYLWVGPVDTPPTGTGVNSLVIGENAQGGSYANGVTIGKDAVGNRTAVSVGAAAVLTGANSVAVGAGTTAGSNSISIGRLTQSDGGGVAVGRLAKALAGGSIAIGDDTDATSTGSVAIGQGLNNAIAESTMIGHGTEHWILRNDGALWYNGNGTGQIVAPPTTTASYPAAIENGAMIYDTDLKSPLWWDGADYLPAGPTAITNGVILRGASLIDQLPVATDTPVQVTFGPSQALPKISLSAAGEFTANIANTYTFSLRAEFGRASNPAAALLFGRVLLNGVQLGDPLYSVLDDSLDRIPVTALLTIPLNIGDVITFEIYRDSTGANSGGLYAAPSTLWGTAPSALMTIVETNLI